MCELKVLQVKDGKNEEIMTEVEKVEVEGHQIRIIDILGREKTIEGTIKSLDMMKNTLQIT